MESAVKVADAVLFKSVTVLNSNWPLGKMPHASSLNCTASPTAGVPAAVRKRAVKTWLSPAGTDARTTGDTACALDAACTDGASAARHVATSSGKGRRLMSLEGNR